MAGGCVENPRLWLNSGLPNPNDWVGRGFTDHHFDWVIGVMPYYTGSSKGPGSARALRLPGPRRARERRACRRRSRRSPRTFSDAGMAGLYDNGVGRSKAGGADGSGGCVGNDLRACCSRNIDRLLNVLVITDDDVEAQNRVTLSTILPPDEHGPVPRVEFHQRARSRAHPRATASSSPAKAARLLQGRRRHERSTGSAGRR